MGAFILHVSNKARQTVKYIPHIAKQNINKNINIHTTKKRSFGTLRFSSFLNLIFDVVCYILLS